MSSLVVRTASSAFATTMPPIRFCACTRKLASTIAAPILDLRGQPVFRGLIGPMPEGKNVIRYESPEVFETLTKEWSAVKAGPPPPSCQRRRVLTTRFDD